MYYPMLRCLFLFTLIVYISSTQLLVGNTEKNSFIINLVHRDSKLSPFYNHSITQPELLRKSVMRSLDRVNHFKSSMFTGTKNFVSDIIPVGGDYLADIYIGRPRVKVYGLVDTGSNLVWLRCAPCKKCYKRNSPVFHPRRSFTYRPLPYRSRFCRALSKTKEGKSNNCLYNYTYGDGMYTLGTLSTDTLYLNSTINMVVPFRKSVVGCSHTKKGLSTFAPQGIIGLGRGMLSLVSQLGAQIDHKFSYCLLPRSTNGISKLKFGKDAEVSKPNSISSTPLISKHPGKYYHVTLKGISIGGYKTNTSLSEGNIIIDSGTTLTTLHSSMYNDLEVIVRDVVGITPVLDGSDTFSLCYERKQFDEIEFPSMVFHFANADVTLELVHTFTNYYNLKCMLITPDDDISIFGNRAQVNFQVEYDLENKKVSFVRSDCRRF